MIQTKTNHAFPALCSRPGTVLLACCMFCAALAVAGDAAAAEIYHTTDGGRTFETQTTPYGATLAVQMLDGNIGYAGGASGRVYKTTDGGTNWPAIGSIGTTLTDISFPPSGGTGYACGINGAISSITSSAVTPMTSVVPDTLLSITFPVNKERFIIRPAKNIPADHVQQY